MCNIKQIRTTLQAEIADVCVAMETCPMVMFESLRARCKILKSLISECYEGNEEYVWEMLKYTDRTN